MAFPDGTADFRSDTVTRPTPAMRRAMAQAEVGDDGFGDDPTVNRLQEALADRLGKEAGVFLPSGVMANQLALRVHIQAGDEVFHPDGAHIRMREAGAGGALAGAQFHALPAPGGALDAADVQTALAAARAAHLRPGLVITENTHGEAGGRVVPLPALQRVAEAARTAGVASHLDGARLFNAAIATGTPVAEFAATADTASVCLSKGLGAPVGSVLVGSAAAMEAARRYRKMYGGAMRQVGILAAAGLVALAEGTDRLAEDHANAKALAMAIAEIAPGAVDPTRVETNIVLVDTTPFGLGDEAVLAELARDGILAVRMRPGVVRFVTHRDVDAADVRRAAHALCRALQERR